MLQLGTFSMAALLINNASKIILDKCKRSDE